MSVDCSHKIVSIDNGSAVATLLLLSLLQYCVYFDEVGVDLKVMWRKIPSDKYFLNL